MFLARDTQFERSIKLEKQKPSKKLTPIKSSHRKSNIECEENNGEFEKWNVQSSLDPTVNNLVNFVKYEPCCVQTKINNDKKEIGKFSFHLHLTIPNFIFEVC